MDFNNGEFVLIDELIFNDKSSFNLQNYLLSVYRLFYLDFLFVQYDDYSCFIKNKFLSSLFLLSFKLGVPLLYGFNSSELIQSALNYKNNKEILLNGVDKHDKGVVYTTVFNDYDIYIKDYFS